MKNLNKLMLSLLILSVFPVNADSKKAKGEAVVTFQNKTYKLPLVMCQSYSTVFSLGTDTSISLKKQPRFMVMGTKTSKKTAAPFHLFLNKKGVYKGLIPFMTLSGKKIVYSGNARRFIEKSGKMAKAETPIEIAITCN